MPFLELVNKHERKITLASKEVHIDKELLPKVSKVDQVCFITLISSAILSLVVSCTPRLSAIFAIELLSHNLAMATARPWSCLFLPEDRIFNTQSQEHFQVHAKKAQKEANLCKMWRKNPGKPS